MPNPDLKRKRPETADIVYSQPANTGAGFDLLTQVTYAIDLLRDKRSPHFFEDIMRFLSLTGAPEDRKKVMRFVLQDHEKVLYNSATGTYTYRPYHDIDSEEGLMKFLQNQHTAQGINVRELKDGWPGADDTIDKLEVKGKLIVLRNKKDNRAKAAWLDDPTLTFEIDDEFRAIWHQNKVPDAADVAKELQENGQLPASKVQTAKKVTKAPEKKKKKARQGGKITNKHMMGILKDYSHLKR